ncbi:MAG: hypothetical protein KUG78_20600 [Kangiellaceae bacterium]|nr:hypothetical protein [Kangiellaceae bacterium]
MIATIILLIYSVPDESGVVSIWLVGYSVSRLGHTFGYLIGNTGARGLFKTLNLFALLGIASYLAISIFVN